MDVAQITDALGQVFNDEQVRVVFWNDPDGEFVESLPDIALEGVKGHCQRKVARTEFSTDDRELGRPELTPLGECGGAVELEIVS